MRRSLTITLLLTAIAAAAGATEYWNDGEPEVVLGAYFDEAGTDTILEGEVPDTLTVRIMMWNGGERGEGNIKALEYCVDLPDGIVLLRDQLPRYSNLAMGAVDSAFVQAVLDQPGDGLLINTLTLLREGEVPYDARITIRPHPVSGFLRYVHQSGPKVTDVEMHQLAPQDAILNPRLASDPFKPVRSRD